MSRAPRVLAALGMVICGAGCAASVLEGMSAAVPQPPGTDRERLLLTAMADALQDSSFRIPVVDGHVLLLRDDPATSPKTLPRGSRVGFVIVSAGDLLKLAYRDGSSRPHYIRLEAESIDDEDAVITLSAYSTVREHEISLCCWTVKKLHHRSSSGWSFSRILSIAEH